ncbi:hypothetical protein GCM10016272_26810 [Psychrobacter glaciei]|uniref:Uncharacterized protein n=1 Tax=Psychrobacter glaciei TaxID=619771 RepID=A0ABQ3GWE9_9GAMM|nr:hypothetical protein GCM10016272_26810 [Psychrobacter glaciei]
MLKCSNAQILKYSNTQILKYSNTQILKYSNTQNHFDYLYQGLSNYNGLLSAVPFIQSVLSSLLA